MVWALGARAWFDSAFPTIDHDMNLSNTVKLLEPHPVPAGLQLIVGSDEN